MENKNNNQGQFQVDLPADVSQGQYANFAIITHSSSDFASFPVYPRQQLSHV